MNKWSLESWKKLVVTQPPGWANDISLKETIQSLKQKPATMQKAMLEHLQTT